MKNLIFKAFIAFALVFTVTTSVFAKPPSNHPCGDECVYSEEICCASPNGTTYFGVNKNH